MQLRDQKDTDEMKKKRSPERAPQSPKVVPRQRYALNPTLHDQQLKASFRFDCGKNYCPSGITLTDLQNAFTVEMYEIEEERYEAQLTVDEDEIIWITANRKDSYLESDVNVFIRNSMDFLRVRQLMADAVVKQPHVRYIDTPLFQTWRPGITGHFADTIKPDINRISTIPAHLKSKIQQSKDTYNSLMFSGLCTLRILPSISETYDPQCFGDDDPLGINELNEIAVQVLVDSNKDLYSIGEYVDKETGRKCSCVKIDLTKYVISELKSEAIKPKSLIDEILKAGLLAASTVMTIQESTPLCPPDLQFNPLHAQQLQNMFRRDSSRLAMKT